MHRFPTLLQRILGRSSRPARGRRARLELEPLADRILLSVTAAPVTGGLAVTATGGSGNDTYLIRLDPTGSSVQVYENNPTLAGSPTFTAAASAVQSIAVNGNGGDDQLIVDFSDGSPLPAGGLSYDGGAAGTNGNSLVLQGSSAFNAEASAATGPSSGSIGFTSGLVVNPIPRTISYTNVQQITDTVQLAPLYLGRLGVVPGSFTFSATNGADVIGIQNGTSVNGQATLAITNADSSKPRTFTPLMFANKPAILVQSLDGADSIDPDYTTAAAGMMSRTITTGAGSDFLWLADLAPHVPVTVNCGSGADTVWLGGNSLNDEQSPVTIHGGSGSDTVDLRDDVFSTPQFAGDYTITSTTVSRPLFGGLTYDKIARLQLDVDAAPHNVNVLSTAAGTRLVIYDGSTTVPNTVNVGSATTSLDAIQGTVAVYPATFPGYFGGGILNVTDQAAAAGHTYTFTPTGLTRDGAANPTVTFDNTLVSLKLTGTAYNDSLVLTQGIPAVPMDLELGAGLNGIYGPNTDNVWQINGYANGEGRALLDGHCTIGGVGGLAGGSGADRFVFLPGGYVPVAINGGGGANTLDYSQYNAGVHVNLGAYGGGTYGYATAVGSSVGNIQNVIGSPYADTLTAGNSNGILIGGGGSDTLVADAGTAPGFTILIAGTTDFDNPHVAANVAAFNALAADWQGTTATNFATQVALLRDTGVTVNGVTYRLNSFSVHDDNAPDTLIGSTAAQAALDWFFADASTDNPVQNFKKGGDAYTGIV
jgi:hypothetical protein